MGVSCSSPPPGGGPISVNDYGFTATYTDSSGDTFCFSSQYHEANGVVQYDRFSTTC